MNARVRMEQFKNFCINPPTDPDADLEQRDWYDMSVGFFLALGANVSEAHHLATEARYTHRYWSEK